MTHCQNNSEAYEQYVLLEYLVYRTYNLLTDLSFRVRLARITYDDTESNRAPVTRYGFLIEDKDLLAARNSVEFLEILDVPINLVDADNLALIGVFQYFIGNTDWSAFRPEPDKDECCHNTKPIGMPGGPVYSVPYDFDLSGLLNTRYANPGGSGYESVSEILWFCNTPSPQLFKIAFLEPVTGVFAQCSRYSRAGLQKVFY